MAEAVYLLCALTSLVCASLLRQHYRATRSRLLLWASLCFVGLAINNTLLVIDLLVFPAVSLEIWRSLSVLLSLGLLLFGLVWDAE